MNTITDRLNETGELVTRSGSAYLLRTNLSGISVCGRINFMAISEADLNRRVPRMTKPCKVCHGVAQGGGWNPNPAGRHGF